MSKKLNTNVVNIQTALHDLLNKDLQPLLEKTEIELGELYAIQSTEQGREMVRVQWQRVQELGKLIDRALGVGSGAIHTAQEARFQLHQLMNAMERVDASDPLIAAFLLRIQDKLGKVS